MVQCFVPDCRHQSESHTCSYYRFPAANKDLPLRQNWISLIRRDDKEPTSASRVCSCHFKDGKRTNLPEIFEERDETKISSQEKSSAHRGFARSKRLRFQEKIITTSRAELSPCGPSNHTSGKQNQAAGEAPLTDPTGDLLMSAEEVKSEPPDEQEEKDFFQRITQEQDKGNMIMRLDPDDGNIMTTLKDSAEDSRKTFVTKSEDFDSETDDAESIEGYSSTDPSSTEISGSMRDTETNEPEIKPAMLFRAAEIGAFRKGNLEAAEDTAIDLSQRSARLTSPVLQIKSTPTSTLGEETLALDLASPSLSTPRKMASDSKVKAPVGKDGARQGQSHSRKRKPNKPHSNKTSDQFRCFPCGTVYPDFAKLREHFLREHMFQTANPIRYKCELCDKLFKRAQDLSDHRLLDHLYKCEVCGMEFLKEVNLQYHKDTSHQKKPRNYVCEICNVDYVTYQRLYMHLSEHEEMKKFLCDVCGKGFAYQGQLTAHRSSHTDQKRFQCEECGKVFAKFQNLQKHQQGHAGMIKPYMCEICGKKLATKESYASHVLVHKGPPPFKCDLCDKRYYTSFNLRSHRKEKHKTSDESPST